ncbi:hypothetical protein ACF3N0_08835 [Moraxella atlantae]|uniref:hypothetical protein n=1 Tax=Faucicola atlantae TaxID=34059 RepID=UPI003751EF7A
MDNFFKNLPINPTVGFILLIIIIGVIFIIYTKMTGNNTKQNNHIGSNNTFTNSNINQQTGDGSIDNKDKP